MAKAAKRPSLDEALDDVTPAPARRETKPAPIASREGMALVGAHLPAKYQKAMKLLSAESGRSQRDLLEEALNMLFVAKGAKLDK